jgi:hypothetical protein
MSERPSSLVRLYSETNNDSRSGWLEHLRCLIKLEVFFWKSIRWSELVCSNKWRFFIASSSLMTLASLTLFLMEELSTSNLRCAW